MTPARVAAALCVLASSSAYAAASKTEQGSPLLPGGDSKAPVSIEADKLVYYDKEQKAVYSGNVVIIQGDTKLTCSTMTIYMEKSAATVKAEPAKPTDTSGLPGSTGQSSRVRHLDCGGPVTVLSKTQTATADSGAYDKPQNKVWLTGHVTLSDGGNVTKGDKLTYDLTSGQATVDTGGASGRVKGQFLPGGAEGGTPAKPKAP
jgi:lipopolysaccharide export system protein LptA